MNKSNEAFKKSLEKTINVVGDGCTDILIVGTCFLIGKSIVRGILRLFTKNKD